jgi:hypothetical protein
LKEARKPTLYFTFSLSPEIHSSISFPNHKQMQHKSILLLLSIEEIKRFNFQTPNTPSPSHHPHPQAPSQIPVICLAQKKTITISSQMPKNLKSKTSKIFPNDVIS